MKHVRVGNTFELETRSGWNMETCRKFDNPAGEIEFLMCISCVCSLNKEHGIEAWLAFWELRNISWFFDEMIYVLCSWNISRAKSSRGEICIQPT